MALALGIAGLSVLFLGLVLTGLGAFMAWQEDADQRRRRKEVRGVEDVLEGLAALADALAKHPIGIRIMFLGILLIIIGGAIGGAGGLI